MIEQYRRQSDGERILSTLDGLDAALKIESIGCSLKLIDIYDGVQFPTPQTPSLKTIFRSDSFKNSFPKNTAGAQK
jgi:hypothetical protein